MQFQLYHHVRACMDSILTSSIFMMTAVLVEIITIIVVMHALVNVSDLVLLIMIIVMIIMTLSISYLVSCKMQYTIVSAKRDLYKLSQYAQ